MTDTLIVVGAGNNPDPYLQEGHERVILLEPNPRLAESLRQKTADSEAVRVEELAVVTNAALNQLHEFNLPEAASVRQPTGLKHLLAGLRLKESHPVATLAASELCKRFELPGEGRHKLIVQANGEEVNIILSLLETGDLSHFQEVTLGARRDAYYDGEQTIDAITASLAKLGFEVRQEKQTDPDWPVWTFEINPLHKVVETLKFELEAQKAESADLKSQKEQLVSENKAKVAEWSEKLEQEKERAQKQLMEEKLSIEEKVKVKAESLLTLEKNNQELKEQLKKIEMELESTKVQLSQLVSEKETSQRNWENERATFNERQEKLQQELQQCRERAVSMERTNSIQAKLLTKVEIDSQDLRSRYAELQKRERELTDLIKELHGKLELASGFFRQIQREHPELIEQY
ncbi:hypothetical protein [Marinimicrobium koreense]|uniref:hypothetical protein n=1 Tax=Marinimicrobium koreense TaxID=306545 RepID=UPI003F726EF3